MNYETEILKLQGQTAALNSILHAVLNTLTPLQVAQAAVVLAMESQGNQHHDLENQTHPTTASERKNVTDACLQLLGALAKQ